jgi:hypothetical protein
MWWGVRLADPVSAALVTVLSAAFGAVQQWVVERQGDRVIERRRLRELGDAERVIAAASGRLAQLRGTEFAALADGEWIAAADAAAGALRDTRIQQLAGTNPGVLVDARRLRELVRVSGALLLPRAGLSAAGVAAYDRLVAECCELVAARARNVDEVMRAVQAELAGEVSELRADVREIARRQRAPSGFEQRYVSYVAEENSTFELFQASAGRQARHAFDRYYAVPSIARRQPPGSDGETIGSGLVGAHAIGPARRVLLLGGAGAGKTTFLRWLAYTAASAVRDGGGQVDRLAEVPFVVSLRQFADRELPGPEDLVRATAPVLAGEKPERWVSDILRSGRALLLVDGVDELLVGRRDDVRRWLAGLLRAYPDARYVVSSRPSAVDDSWLPDEDGGGLTRFELLPLSVRGLHNLIEHWFTAARSHESEPEQREWLGLCEERLNKELSGRPDVRSLVSSPLLCSLLCALYRRENMYLPQSRKELLDKALDLLLGEWDVRRGVPVEDELRMSVKEKIILLERFAAPMVRGAELLVGRDDAENRFARAMSGLRSRGIDPEAVLRHMVERTGLLRQSPADNKIQFVHRTFRDFLAAGEFVKAGDLGYLVDHAHDDALHEVIFMAAAQARAREAGELLSRLLERAGRRGTRREVADRLTLLAAASLGYVDVIDPDSVRAAVQAAVRRLIPPTDLNAAELLARAGSFVIDLLPGPIEIGKYAKENGVDQATVAACVIRALAMVGREEAWDKIQAFSGVHRAAVIDELLRAWRQFEYREDYAADLLSNVDFGDRVLEVHRWEVLTQLRHLRTLSALQLVGDISLADPVARHYPLAEIPELTYLEIKSNEVARSLDGLAGCAKLRRLWITGYSAVRDLSAVAGLRLDELALRARGYLAGAEPDLGSLAGAGVRRLIIRHPALANGLHALPDLPLTELTVRVRADQRNLLGISRFATLEKVDVEGVPTEAEIEELATLKRLDRLTLGRVDRVADVAPLRALDGKTVELTVRPADERAVRAMLVGVDLVLRVTREAGP